MLQRYDLGEGVCNDYLSVDHPEIVAEIHNAYLRAGADIISTNSFNANAISLTEYGLSDRAYEIARAAASVARKCADTHSAPGQPRFVAGSMGPTNRTLSMSADVNSPADRDVAFDEMYAAYSAQAKGLIDGGADIILIETIFDTLNAKAAIKAVRDLNADIPVMLSATVSDASGRTLTGQTIEAFYASVAHARPLTVGLNCGFGAKHLLPYLRRLAEVADSGVSVHPNAGLPNVLGGYDETPEMFADDMSRFMEEGLVNIAGGCCGTTPEHISALAAAARHYKPRRTKTPKHICTLSGLEPLTIGAALQPQDAASAPVATFTNIGERANVAGSAKFARLIREGAYDEALAIALAQVQAGALIVDVCMDAALIDGVGAMRRFLNLMASEPDIARVPVMIDSSKWPVIEAGLQCVQGKAIVNSISLKEGEEAFLDKARKIMAYGAAAVVMLFDEEGQADSCERKIAVARRAYNLLMKIRFPQEDIIFDPNVLAVATGIAGHDRYALDFIEATRWIKTNLPGAKVSGGVSNLSFAFRGNNAVRKAMHAVFLYHAIAAGMDMAIMNPQMVQMYDDIEPALLALAEDLVLYRREDAADRLIEHAKDLMEASSSSRIPEGGASEWRNAPVDERIAHALLKGIAEHIADDALEACRLTGDAVAVIDTILMPAMARIGQLFGRGKMFLPQVVKSARVMKLAVAALQPYITGANDGSPDIKKKRRTVVMATVKGDVHDIGKNIVGLVLACNGYDIADLGVMVPSEKIIDAAIANDAAAICLSGLITPSLDEMIHVAQEAERRGLNVPILVGGATTSAMHTALKIAPVTHAPVIHSTDAANNASIIAALTSDEHDAYVARVREAQARLVEEYRAAKAAACTCCAPKTAPAFKKRAHAVAAPSHSCDFTGRIAATSDAAHPIVEKINWSFFFAGWDLPGRYPDIFDNPERGEEARKLYADAQEMLPRLDVELQGVVRTFKAEAHGDYIVILSPETGKETHRLKMRRSATTGECAADFVEQSGGEVTLFSITAGAGLNELAQKYREAGDDYSAIMAKLLCDRLVEAWAETLLPGGCRIAIGYPTAPDHALKRDLFDILEVERHTDMRLTESNMIMPGESICGLWFAKGHFFDART